MKTLYHVSIKKAVTFLILFFLFAAGSIAQPQFYNYQNVGVSSNFFPFGVIAGKQVQWLCLPNEFTQPNPCPAGNITKLYFFMTGTSANTLTNLTIKLGQSDITTLPTGAWYSGQLDTVYYSATTNLSSTALGWMSITLNRPFAYNPSQSLIMDISQCAATSTTMTVRQNGLSGFRRSYSLTPGSCPFTWGGQDANIANCGVDIAPGNCTYTWASQTSGTTQALRSVKAVNDQIVWAAGAAGTIRKTTNGGATWTDGNPNPTVVNQLIYNIDAIDANNAWCTTSPGATFIYRTTNGGTNWTQVFTEPTPGFINAIQFINANTGFAQGDPISTRWSLWKSTNAGATWDSTGLNLPRSGTEAGWVNSMIIIGNNIWFGTNNTRVYKSTNFGANWTFGTTTGLVNSYSVHFNSPTLGLAGGTSIAKSTDGGANYTAVTGAPGTGNINAIDGKENHFWYIRGTGIYRSTNSGDNWAQAHTITGTGNDMDFHEAAGCLVGWAVSSNGTVYKMTGVPVGVGNNVSLIPAEYELKQNYPNPFNPVTEISFALPKAGHVELKVYDVLGKEVAVLINEFRQAGTYNINFNASALASGQYFYSIKSGDFTASKKMVLIK